MFNVRELRNGYERGRPKQRAKKIVAKVSEMVIVSRVCDQNATRFLVVCWADVFFGLFDTLID